MLQLDPIYLNRQDFLIAIKCKKYMLLELLYAY